MENRRNQIDSKQPNTLTFGILSLLLNPVLGVIFGAIGRKKGRDHIAQGNELNGSSKVGYVLSLIGLILSIAVTAALYVFLLVLASLFTAEDSIFYFKWEMQLMEWLQSHIGSSGFAFWLLSNLSAFGEEILLIAIMGFLYWGLNKEFGKYVGVNVLVANVWNPMIKNVILRLRPYFVKGYRVELLRKIDANAEIDDVAAQGYSFPSGHSSNAVTMYGSLAAHEKKYKLFWILAIVLPLLVGFSRVFVGAHFPTDVFAGWALGIVIVLLIPFLRRKIKNRWIFYGILLLTTLPGFFYCKTDDYFSSFGMLIGFIFAEPFEERFVRFENTKNFIRCILRTIGGGLIYFGLNTVLKMPFPKAMLEAGDLVSHLIRTLRYAVVIFTVIGVYPMLFKQTDKLWNRIFKRKEAKLSK